MQKIKTAIFAATIAAALPAIAAEPMGFAEGCEVIEVPVTEGRIDTVSGIVYSQVKGLRSVRALKMTVMIPRNRAKKPAIVYFPGGGFTSADYEKFTEMRYALARAGFVVAAAEYRAVPSRFPALVEDGKAAVRFLRAHAGDYGIDPARIGVLGDSAGGYLVEMLGAINGEKGWDKGDFLTESSDVQAVVSMYGLSNLLTVGAGLNQDSIHASPAVTEALLVHGVAFRDFPGASILSDREKALHASPIGHVDGSEPPTLLMHGSADTLVSPLQSRELFEAMKAKNADVQYVLVRDAQHGNLPWFQTPIIERVVNFFREKLGDPGSAEEGAGGNL